MFELALKAAIPIIGVHTDDPVNRVRVLQLIAEVKALQYHSTIKSFAPGIYWTDDPNDVTTEVYLKFRKEDRTLVVFNPPMDNELIIDCGTLPTPVKPMMSLIEEFVEPIYAPGVSQVLKGLSLKRIDEILKLTRARVGDVTAPEVRRTRSQVGETVQGLYPVDTTYDFYDFPPKLSKWLALNKPYFLDVKTPAKLVPRGVLLDGPPGVGKSMSAKAIAHELGVPLYRLDIASTLNRYIGESEARVNRSLALLEREGPCVLLLDEVEKVFSDKDDGGVTNRIMSQLLWWLADHQSRVLTVMTTNDVTSIPPELYRTGRVDMVMKIPRMGFTDARTFANMVYKGVMSKAPITKHLHTISEALKVTGTDDYSHAEVAELVYTQIKQHQWLK